MRKFLLLAVLLISKTLIAQDNYEIQVYGSQTQDKGTTQFELHSNFTFNGQQNIINGVRPTYHSLHETVEITHGFTNNFEIGFYFFTNYTSPYGYQYVGSHIRPRIMVPEKWNWPVGVSISMEVGYQKPEYSEDTWTWEIRPIIDKQWNKLYVSFNPTLGVSIKGLNQNAAPDFEPNLKVDYQFLKNGSFGVEYYGAVGPINNFDNPPQQNHAMYLTYDLENNAKWEFNVGAGFGLTPATDGFVFKTIVGRRISWKKKKK